MKEWWLVGEHFKDEKVYWASARILIYLFPVLQLNNLNTQNK